MTLPDPNTLDWGSMSKAEFKRNELAYELEHEDRAIADSRKMEPVTVLPLKTMFNVEMLALAYAVYRMNGNQYIKNTRRFSEGTPTQFANKELMKYIIARKTQANPYVPDDVPEVAVTEEDYASVERARQHMKRYTLQILGDSLNDFQKTVFEAYSADNIPVNKAGLIAYLPQLVDREMEDIAFKKLLRMEYRDSAHIRQEKDPVEGVIKILRKSYSEQWEKYNYVADFNGNLVSFMNGFDHPVGSRKRIKAKVKGHTRNRNFSVDETRLNYVKLYKV